MPKVTYKIITPRGEFGSARKAGVAHDCDPGTIVKRCESDPLNYKRIAKQPGAVKPRAKKIQWVTKKITWPLTWAEYRYNPSRISSLFRSTAAGTIDGWHLAQKFTALPTLNNTFIQENPPVSRVVAVGAAANGQQFIFDSFFDVKKARPMPMYSVPGLIDHF
jgi:hypothetical protein